MHEEERFLKPRDVYHVPTTRQRKSPHPHELTTDWNKPRRLCTWEGGGVVLLTTQHACQHP